MAAARTDLPERRASWASSQVLRASTSGLLSAWRRGPRGARGRGSAAADLVLDGIERSDALQRLIGDRRRATLGDLVEAPADMGPAEGERHGAALPPGIGQLPVGRIAVALHDAGIAGERLQPLFGAAPGRVGIDDGGRIGAAPGAVVARHR